MRIRLQDLLRGTAVAAVMAAALAISTGSAHADDVGDALRAALAESGAANNPAIAAVLSGTTDGATMLNQLNALSLSLPNQVASLLGASLAAASNNLSANNPLGANQIQQAVASNNNPVVSGGFVGNIQTAAGGGGGAGALGGAGAPGGGGAGGGGGGGGNPFFSSGGFSGGFQSPFQVGPYGT